MIHQEYSRFKHIKSFFAMFVMVIITTLMLSFVYGCKKSGKPNATSPIQVTTVKLEPKDTPVVFEFVGQTKSSHQVEIRARVNGFLDKRVYTEGAVVKAGDVMFKMDPKPFQAQLDAAQASLAQHRAEPGKALDPS